jgi:hypothetical protein
MDLDGINVVRKPSASKRPEKRKRIDKKKTKPRNEMVFRSLTRSKGKKGGKK